MATAMDNDSGIETSGMPFGSSTSKKKNVNEVPDYNDAFPQLVPAAQLDSNRTHTFFPSAFPLASNGNNSAGATANTTTSLYTTSKNDEDRRRKMAIHASSATTKIVSLVTLISLY